MREMNISATVQKISLILAGRGSKRRKRVIRYALPDGMELQGPVSCEGVMLHFRQFVERGGKIVMGGGHGCQ